MATKTLKRKTVACRACGAVAPVVVRRPHGWYLEFLLWFCGVLPILAIPTKWIAIFIMPAFFYTIWRRVMAKEHCSKCDSTYVYPTSSLTGKRIMEATRESQA